MKTLALAAASLAAAVALSGCATRGLDLKEINKTLTLLNKACDTDVKVHAEAHAGQLGGEVGGIFDASQKCGPEIKASGAKPGGLKVGDVAVPAAPPATPPA